MLRRKKKKKGVKRAPRVQKRAIINKDLLVAMSMPGFCELCGTWFMKREAHHVFERGAGGWCRFDIPINLISVGASEYFTCECHRKAQAHKIPRSEVLAIVAKRERVTVEFIEAEINRLKWGSDNSGYRD